MHRPRARDPQPLGSPARLWPSSQPPEPTGAPTLGLAGFLSIALWGHQPTCAHPLPERYDSAPVRHLGMRANHQGVNQPAGCKAWRELSHSSEPLSPHLGNGNSCIYSCSRHLTTYEGLKALQAGTSDPLSPPSSLLSPQSERPCGKLRVQFGLPKHHLVWGKLLMIF